MINIAEESRMTRQEWEDISEYSNKSINREEAELALYLMHSAFKAGAVLGAVTTMFAFVITFLLMKVI